VEHAHRPAVCGRISLRWSGDLVKASSSWRSFLWTTRASWSKKRPGASAATLKLG
jgi:hypothetical protein